MKVYVTVWSNIKVNSSCFNGSKHLFRMIELSRYLDELEKLLIDAVININNCFARPESFPLAMLSDDRKHIHELAHRKILAAIRYYSTLSRTNVR
jgi:hypothetical protein